MVTKRTSSLYDGYDYSTFWEGREYENTADEIAITRLLKKISTHFFGYNLIDIGSAMGRLTHFYEHIAEKITLLDPSLDQLEHARSAMPRSQKYRFVTGAIESMPFNNSSFNFAISVRVFHYVRDPRRAIKEVARILEEKGYFILEIPNAFHIKNRIKSLYSRSHVKQSPSEDLRDEGIYFNSECLFLNHNPENIRKILIEEKFEIIEILSVSNFRHRFFKNIVPSAVLNYLEKHLQKTLAKVLFGPSIYFLARKKESR